MEPNDESVDGVVIQYLQRKGYRQAASALATETAISLSAHARKITESDQVVSAIRLHDSQAYTVERYNQSYTLFANWVLSSLDLYKVSRLHFDRGDAVRCFSRAGQTRHATFTAAAGKPAFFADFSSSIG